MLIDHSGSSSYFKLYGQESPYVNQLRKFGEMGIVYKNDPIKSKLADRGFPAVFVGYPSNHAEHTYQFYNVHTQKTFLSRNIIWLDKNYGDYYHLQGVNIHTIPDDPEEEEILTPKFEAETTIPEEDPPTAQPTGSRVSGLNRQLYHLTTSYNPDPISHMDPNTALQAVIDDEFAFTTMVPEMNMFPRNYHEAMKQTAKQHWWDAMVLEFDNITEKQVWKIIKKCNIPKGRKIIGNRWVYVQKDDGRYRARTVAQGFSQVPGKDFQENHAPVIHDIPFRMVLLLK